MDFMLVFLISFLLAILYIHTYTIMHRGDYWTWTTKSAHKYSHIFATHNNNYFQCLGHPIYTHTHLQNNRNCREWFNNAWNNQVTKALIEKDSSLTAFRLVWCWLFPSEMIPRSLGGSLFAFHFLNCCWYIPMHTTLLPSLLLSQSLLILFLWLLGFHTA